MKRTLIIGATDNPERYGYKAARSLKNHGYEIIPVGIKKGFSEGIPIINTKEIQKDIDTITLYISPEHQKEWYDYILLTNPKRIIFNPGAENEELKVMATNNGIETVEGCTLVMLSIGNY